MLIQYNLRGEKFTGCHVLSELADIIPNKRIELQKKKNPRNTSMWVQEKISGLISPTGKSCTWDIDAGQPID